MKAKAFINQAKREAKLIDALLLARYMLVMSIELNVEPFTGLEPASIKGRPRPGLHFCVNPDESVQRLGM